MIFDGDSDLISPYLRELADLVGLRDWTVQVSNDPPDNPQHAACIDVRYGRKWMVVSFHPNWANESPETFRTTCVHELLHAHVNHVRHPLDNIESIVGSAVYNPLWNSVTDYIEYAVDAISTEWSRTLPLPVTAKKRKGAKTA